MAPPQYEPFISTAQSIQCVLSFYHRVSGLIGLACAYRITAVSVAGTCAASRLAVTDLISRSIRHLPERADTAYPQKNRIHNSLPALVATEPGSVGSRSTTDMRSWASSLLSTPRIRDSREYSPTSVLLALFYDSHSQGAYHYEFIARASLRFATFRAFFSGSPSFSAARISASAASTSVPDNHPTTVSA